MWVGLRIHHHSVVVREWELWFVSGAVSGLRLWVQILCCTPCTHMFVLHKIYRITLWLSLQTLVWKIGIQVQRLGWTYAVWCDPTARGSWEFCGCRWCEMVGVCDWSVPPLTRESGNRRNRTRQLTYGRNAHLLQLSQEQMVWRTAGLFYSPFLLRLAERCSLETHVWCSSCCSDCSVSLARCSTWTSSIFKRL